MKMGLLAEQVDRLMFAEWRCVREGWNAVHGGPAKPSAPTIEEHAARLARARDR